MVALALSTPHVPVSSPVSNLHAEEERERRTLHLTMLHPVRPCFTGDLVDAIVHQQTRLVGSQKVDFLTLRSASAAHFNLGGDLQLFGNLIARRDRARLEWYAHRCIEGVYNFSSGCEGTVISVALVSGAALGGGFEVALACNVLIAERTARMGFPEMLFNLFPGMGALTFLARKAGPAAARELLMSGRTVSAERLHELGVVDVLAEPGELDATARRWVAQALPRAAGMKALLGAARFSPLGVSMAELRVIADAWVDAALELGPRDLRVMERLVRAQDRAALGA